MRHLIWLIVTGLLTLAICLLLLEGKLPLGIRGEWVWGRIDTPVFWIGVVSLCGGYVAAVALSARWLADRSRFRTAFFVIALIPAGFAVQMNLQQLGYGLGKWPFVLYNFSSSGYYTTATGIRSASEFLENYPEFQASHGPFHLGTHPPGLVLMHYGALRLCESNLELTDWLLRYEPQAVREGFRDVAVRTVVPGPHQASIWLVALVSQLASALTIVPIYVLARRGSGPQASFLAAGLWPLVPAVTLLMPKSDVLYSLPAAVCVALMLNGRHAGTRIACSVVAGLVLWLGMFLTFGLVAVVPLVGLAVVVGEGSLNRSGISACVSRFGCLAAGFLVPTAIFASATGQNLLATWFACYKKHATFYEVMPRSYWPWIGFNAAEFAVAVGLPMALAACVGTIQILRSRRAVVDVEQVSESSSSLAVHDARRTMALTAAWWVTVLALDLSGKNLGEVARLWIFLMPFALPATATAVDRSARPVSTGIVLLSLQALQAIVFAASVQTFIDPQSVKISVGHELKRELSFELMSLEIIPAGPVSCGLRSPGPG